VIKNKKKERQLEPPLLNPSDSTANIIII